MKINEAETTLESVNFHYVKLSLYKKNILFFQNTFLDRKDRNIYMFGMTWGCWNDINDEIILFWCFFSLCMWLRWIASYSRHASESLLCCFYDLKGSFVVGNWRWNKLQSNFRFFLIHANRMNQSAYLPLAKQLSILISRSLIILSAVECYHKVLSFSSSIICAFSIWVV